MSVVDILRKHGQWMETKEFVTLAAEQMNKSERQIYRDIKKAWKNKDILKEVLPDRSVLCGLSEFGPITKKPKGALSFKDAFFYRCFRNLEQIINENVEGDSLKAFQYLKNLKAMLPQSLKEKINEDFERANREIYSIKIPYSSYATYRQRKNTAFIWVQKLVDRISTVLHERAESEE